LFFKNQEKIKEEEYMEINIPELLLVATMAALIGFLAGAVVCMQELKTLMRLEKEYDGETALEMLLHRNCFGTIFWITVIFMAILLFAEYFSY
jgi:hypothetical protein